MPYLDCPALLDIARYTFSVATMQRRAPLVTTAILPIFCTLFAPPRAHLVGPFKYDKSVRRVSRFHSYREKPEAEPEPVGQKGGSAGHTVV